MGKQQGETESIISSINPTILSLDSLLDVLAKPEDFLHTLLLPPSQSNVSNNGKSHLDGNDRKLYQQQINSLRNTSKVLFERIEQLALLEQNLLIKAKIFHHSFLENPTVEEKEGEEVVEQIACPLSGLPELYIGQNPTNDTDIATYNVDAETIWGQIDIQNTSLLPKLSKCLKKLSKKVDESNNWGDKHESMIQLLSLKCLNSDLDDDSNIENNPIDEESSYNEDVAPNAVVEKDIDEDTNRIQERMERAMENAGKTDSDGDDLLLQGTQKNDEEENTSEVKKQEEEEEIVDEAAEQLNDGFFDLNDMENFADDEEDMLPDEALGDTNALREEDNLSEKEDDINNNFGDEGLNNLENRMDSSIKRRRYRDDEDIEALDYLYHQNIGDEDNSEDGEDDSDAANMSAIEFFGKPNKKYLEKNTKKKNLTDGNEKSFESIHGDDVDSWDDESFEEKGKNWREGMMDDVKQKNNEVTSNIKENSDENYQIDNTKEKVVTEVHTDSTFVSQSRKLLTLTEQLEKEALAEKPWQMVGESSAVARPTNSLLETTPEFEVATKMAPMITIEHTLSIEDVIKQRIIEEDWDDVVPRELHDIGINQKNSEIPELSQEKSKLSLGALYEREYLKKATGYDTTAGEKETNEEKAKNEMKTIFTNICSNLDALSNYHFTPRPLADKTEIKSLATPAISMEEVLPLHFSNAKVSAPEESYGQKKGKESVLRGDTEMDKSEKKRFRQAKKAARRKERKAKRADENLISKLQPGLGLDNPYEKRKMREELQMARASGKIVSGEKDNNQDYSTSAKFFQSIQRGVQQSIQGDNSERQKRRKLDSLEIAGNSSALKL